MNDEFIKSPLNYIGGKYRILPQITKFFPERINKFVDIFAGGLDVAINVQADEIYCNDINPNEWWNEFDVKVDKFNYVFISSKFKGRIEERLNEISASTGVNGAVLNSENLLYLAEKLKSGDIKYQESFKLFDKNQEITF